MKKIFIGVIVAAALVVGVGGGYLAAKGMPVFQSNDEEVKGRFNLPDLDDGWMPFDRNRQEFRSFGPGMMDPQWRMYPQGRMDRRGSGYPGGGRMGPGMFNGYQPGTSGQQLERITIDDAAAKAQEYAAGVGDNLRVAEVMEFEYNFYAVVLESETGKGAFEVLVDPYTGGATLEMGPSRMWNTKYGHMRRSADAPATNTVTLDEAITFAQTALDERVPGAVVSENGIDFYGYYSFDYEIDGKVAGMLSVYGGDGQVWFHTWHGTFVAEKEITQ